MAEQAWLFLYETAIIYTQAIGEDGRKSAMNDEF